MGSVEDIVRSNLKPKEKQEKLTEGLCSGAIGHKEFIDFFTSASYGDKGTCADVMKHVSERKPEILWPYIDLFIGYICHKAPRVRWGMAETIGNLAGTYPDLTAGAVPHLLKNTAEESENTTVTRWCAAYGLSEILKHCAPAREELVPKIKEIVRKEKNNGVKNVYLKALNSIEGKEYLLG